MIIALRGAVLAVGGRSAAVAVIAGVLVTLAVLAVGGGARPGRITDTATSHEPIVLFCSRTVSDADAYKEAFGAFAEHMQAGTPGCKAMFSFMDGPTTALQFYWFDSVMSLFAQPTDMPELAAAKDATYAGTPETDFCQVFGGWTEDLKAAASHIPGVAYHFGKVNAGFLRNDPPPEGAVSGTPMIWVRKHVVTSDDYYPASKKLTTAQFASAPGLAGTLNFDDAEEKRVWDLRVFTDFMTGVVGHFVPNQDIIMNEWVPTYSQAFEYAVYFGSKTDNEKLLGMNPYNKAYKPFYFDEGRIGPLPDFS